MKDIKKAVFAILFMLSAVSLTACGGGGSTAPGGNGVTSPGVSKGVITSFGSIFVNGIEFKTANANLNLPDDPTLSTKLGATETEIQGKLKVGMVVSVKGTFDDKNGIATEIEFRDNLEAKLGSKDDANRTLVINGVTIVTDDATKIHGVDDSVITFASIPATARLEVSGLPDDKGGLRATFIKVKKNVEDGVIDQEIKGFIVAITGTTSFDIGMSKGFKSITVPGNIKASLPTAAIGDFVEVKLNAAGALTKVEAENELHAAENEKTAIEGLVASGTADDFVINGQPVHIAATTVFVGGIKTNIVPGRKLEAQGPIVNGILNATTITFKVVNSTLSTGEIQKFGSLFVNGVEFNTLGATLHLRDTKTDKILQSEAEIQSQLKPGMIVTVKGGVDDNGATGIAQEIEIRDNLKGKIDSVDAVNKTITVMGQIINIEDNVTRLNDDSTLKVFGDAGFAAGNFVEVNGLPDDKGGLRATRVAKRAEGELEVKGFVASIGSGSFGLSLTPGGTSNLTVTGTLPVGAVVGSLVEVKSSVAPVGGAVTASAVQLEDKLVGGDKVRAEGIVASGDVTSFVVNGQKVVTNASTLFEGGLSSDFAVGVKVEAQGPLDANGAIAAVKISFRSNIKIEADISAFSAGSSLTLLGKAIAINQFTRPDAGLTGIGNHVEVRANLDRNGNLIASRIVVKSPSARAFLQGPVAVNAGAMTILGVPVSTGAATQFRISTDVAQQAVDSASFFAQLKSGVTVVKVRWATSDTTAAADQAEIQLGK